MTAAANKTSTTTFATFHSIKAKYLLLIYNRLQFTPSTATILTQSTRLSRIAAGIILLALFVLCLFLGNWQLVRAAEKQILADAGNQKYTAAQVLETPAKSLWASTTFHGSYLNETPILLGNQTYHGQQGFQVFSRFLLNSGAYILVNRGWIDKQSQPTTPATKQTTITGLVAPYRRAGFRLGPAVVSPPEKQPVVVNYPTQQEWERLYQSPLLPITLWLAADQAHGYVRDWQLKSIAPEKHLGYAFQWFAMATAVAVISIILLIRIRRKHD